MYQVLLEQHICLLESEESKIFLGFLTEWHQTRIVYQPSILSVQHFVYGQSLNLCAVLYQFQTADVYLPYFDTFYESDIFPPHLKHFSLGRHDSDELDHILSNLKLDLMFHHDLFLV